MFKRYTSEGRSCVRKASRRSPPSLARRISMQVQQVVPGLRTYVESPTRTTVQGGAHSARTDKATTPKDAGSTPSSTASPGLGSRRWNDSPPETTRLFLRRNPTHISTQLSSDMGESPRVEFQATRPVRSRHRPPTECTPHHEDTHRRLRSNLQDHATHTQLQKKLVAGAQAWHPPHPALAVMFWVSRA